ncbi:MAG: pyridoxal-phosphate dependent enzyme, partial [Solobacterium sp.]|nr:pyridoxal-phosphate dependent enzyme [Solobacterium sp.]
VLLDQKDSGELAVRSGSRLEGHVVHSGYLKEISRCGVERFFYKEAVDAAFMAYSKEYKDAIYCIGTAAGPHPFPLMVRDFQFCVGAEARDQFVEMTGHLPDQVIACVGGGSNSIGMFTPFLADPVELVGVEPLGRGEKIGDNAATITYGREGIMHGFNSIMLADENGDPAPVYSNASGLDYPSVGPEHAMLHDMGRISYVTIGDEEAIEALFLLSRNEGIIPAIESSHALAHAIRIARSGITGSVLVNLSGRGDKDLDFVAEHYGYGPDFLAKRGVKSGR